MMALSYRELIGSAKVFCVFQHANGRLYRYVMELVPRLFLKMLFI